MIVVTSRTLCNRPFLEQVELILDAGPELLILREKDLDPQTYMGLAEEVHGLCRTYDVPMAVNSRMDVAEQLGIGCVHLNSCQLDMVDKARFELIGASIHSVDEARRAECNGADYLIAGHVFDTSCKSTPSRGLNFLRAVCESVDIPVYGIGGITCENYRDVLSTGAAGAACMSSMMQSDDPSEMIRAMPPTVKSIFR